MNITTGELARFIYDGWLSKDEPPYKIEVQNQGRMGKAYIFKIERKREGAGG